MVIQFPHKSRKPVPSEIPQARPIGLYLLLAFSLLYLAGVLWVQHYVPKRQPEPTPATKQATTPLVPMKDSGNKSVVPPHLFGLSRFPRHCLFLHPDCTKFHARTDLMAGISFANQPNAVFINF